MKIKIYSIWLTLLLLSVAAYALPVDIQLSHYNSWNISDDGIDNIVITSQVEVGKSHRSFLLPYFLVDGVFVPPESPMESKLIDGDNMVYFFKFSRSSIVRYKKSVILYGGINIKIKDLTLDIAEINSRH